MTKVYLCILLPAAAILGQTTQKAPERKKKWRGSTVSAIRLDAKNEEWRFRGHAGGIAAVRTKDGAESRYELELEGKVKNVRRVVAASGEGFGMTYMALAVESVSDDGKNLEYRLVIGNYQVDDPIWFPSIVFIRRPVDNPFLLMGAALIGGDSVMLTLQDIKRDRTGKPDDIETHTFVDHCPVPMSLVADHYHEPKMNRIAKNIGVKKEKEDLKNADADK